MSTKYALFIDVVLENNELSQFDLFCLFLRDIAYSWTWLWIYYLLTQGSSKWVQTEYYFNIQTVFVFQTKIPGIGFLKIHAPWNVLCREAEFMKLKMPTKKVLHPSVNRQFVKCIISRSFVLSLG